MSKPKSISFATKEGKDLKAKRSLQLADLELVIGELTRRLDRALSVAPEFANVKSHTQTLSQEIDKQFKKSPVEPASNLMIDEVNAVIQDTKDLLGEEDRYLSRIKKFEPAGDNPEIRDVSLILSQLIQCHNRLSDVPKNSAGSLRTSLREARLFRECVSHFLKTGQELSYSESAFASDDMAEWFSDDDYESFVFEDLDDTDILNYFEYERESEESAD